MTVSEAVHVLLEAANRLNGFELSEEWKNAK